MKRASYQFGVAWIAMNDDAAETSAVTVAEQISVLLLADLFEVGPSKVAVDVLMFRSKAINRATRSKDTGNRYGEYQP